MTSYDPEDDPQTFGVSGAAEPDSIHEDPDMRQGEDRDPAPLARGPADRPEAGGARLLAVPLRAGHGDAQVGHRPLGCD